jgi:hypothetical protein
METPIEISNSSAPPSPMETQPVKKRKVLNVPNYDAP